MAVNMSIFWRLIAVFVLGFSGIVVADTYSAVATYKLGGSGPAYSSVGAVCVTLVNAHYTYTVGTHGPSGFSCDQTQKCPDSWFGNGGCAYDGYLEVDPFYACPNGGTVSGSSCINVPPCVAPNSVRNSTTGACEPPPVSCPVGQYSLNPPDCIPIPDCNATSIVGGYFFDVTSKSCVAYPHVGMICIGGTDKYCAPIDDCKPAGYICTNEPNVLTAAASSRAADIASAKARADAAAANASADSVVANAIKAAKTDAQAAAAAAVVAARQAAIDISATPAQQAAAQDVFSKAVSASLAAVSDAANATAAAAVAALKAASAYTPASQIVPPINPGNAGALAKQAELAQQGADTGVTSAKNGTGNGTATSTPQMDTTGLAKDSTVQGLKGSIDKLGGDSTSGGFVDSAASFYDSSYPGGLAGVWNAGKAALNQTAFVSSISALTPNLGNSGACPSWSFTFYKFGTQTLNMSCEVWPFLRVFFMIATLFYARQIIFGG